jgi:hypothetical protein
VLPDKADKNKHINITLGRRHGQESATIYPVQTKKKD